MAENIYIIPMDTSKIDNSFEVNESGNNFEKIAILMHYQTNCVSITSFGLKNGEKVQILQEQENTYQIGKFYY